MKEGLGERKWIIQDHLSHGAAGVPNMQTGAAVEEQYTVNKSSDRKKKRKINLFLFLGEEGLLLGKWIVCKRVATGP